MMIEYMAGAAMAILWKTTL